MTAGRAASCAAAFVALATLSAGIHWGSTVAGGADSYGYVSQAALWRSGRLTIREPIARQSPWPSAIETWSPLGYRPSPGSRDSIVPVYSPGLPLLMAAFQAVGGFCAAFLVVPLCGALTVWLTYALGRRLGASPPASIAAAILVATSPAFLYQLMNPMSDVPATAAWTLATVLVAGGFPLSGGAAAGAALLVRPNLVPMAATMAAWLLADRRSAVRFMAGMAPAIVAVASINTALYGAPWLSGYGAAADLYSIRFGPVNLRQFVNWIVETQTPVVSIALVPLVFPRPSSSIETRRLRLLAAGVIASAWFSYLFYIPFDAWWYVRFLLPMWPPMMVLVAVAAEESVEWIAGGEPGSRHRWRRRFVWIGVAALAANGVRIAAARSAFDLGRGERRYIDVARFVASHTDPAAVMISLQHSGTLRLYGGRLTLRFDQLDGLWLDRAVAFLDNRRRHPYIVVERDEVDRFRRQFASTATGRLDWAPLATLDDGTLVYDAVDRTARGAPLAIGAAASRRTGWRCDPPYDERVPLRTE